MTLTSTARIFGLFVVTLLAREVCSKCTAIISEINGDKPPTNSFSGVFIELEFSCSSKETPRANGYKIIIINGKQKQPELELYANLQEFAVTNRRFYTIGEDGTHNTNMNFSNNQIF